MDSTTLIESYLRGDATDSQVDALDCLLLENPELRAEFRFHAELDSNLHDASREFDFDADNQSLTTTSGPRPLQLAGGLIAMAAVLALLASLFVFNQSRPTEIATITRLGGMVQWTGDGGNVTSDLQVGSPLTGGTLESLSPESYISLRFHDGTTATLSGLSELTVSAQTQKHLRLTKGALSADVSAQHDNPLLIHTPVADLHVPAASLDVRVKSSVTVVSVLNGSVEMVRLSDQERATVPAEHQASASLSSQQAIHVRSRSQPTQLWKSNLPQDIMHGQWRAEFGGSVIGLRATPLLSRDADQNTEVVYHASASVPLEPPVVLATDSRLRIDGKTDGSADLTVGVTARHSSGGFAGKYIVRRSARSLPSQGGHFNLEIPISELVPCETEFPASAVDLELSDWWCGTSDVDIGLSVFSVSLVPDE